MAYEEEVRDLARDAIRCHAMENAAVAEALHNFAPEVVAAIAGMIA